MDTRTHTCHTRVTHTCAHRTAAAEALNMLRNEKKPAYIVADNVHPQTIAVVKTRARALDVEVCGVQPLTRITPAIPPHNMHPPALNRSAWCPCTTSR